MRTQTVQTEKSVTSTGLLHLSVVYVVWSSTYLAIRIAVREGSGFPPFTMGLMRVIVAGLLLLAWARLRKRRVLPTGRELLLLAGSGVLLWTGGNGLVMYAEQYADSGLAALLVASLPIWGAVTEAVLDRRLPSPALAISLLVGFVGIGVLVAPSLLQGVQADFFSALALVAGAISWCFGTILQARRPVALGPTVSSAYQMLTGGVGFLVLIFLTNEPLPTPNADAWWAYGYLVVFGTLAFISFVTALQLLPINVVFTYAYVNPVLAVVLGWLILGEAITWWTVAGSALVLLGVAGVFRERRKIRKQTKL
jgi:drug/metabolite transporter (DMT)-like permease